MIVNPTASTFITSQSTPTETVCLGDPLSAISVTVPGNNVTYQWYSNTTSNNSGGTSLGSASGAQTSTYTPDASVAGTMYYYCVVTGGCDGSTETSAVSGALIVNPVSNFITSSSEVSQEVCLGSSFNPISISATGTTLTYQWYSNTTPSNIGSTMISGATSPSYTPDASTVGSMYYYCVVSNLCSSNVQGPISEAMVVNESVTLEGSLNQDQTICLGEALLPLSSFVSSGSVNSYQWYSNTVDDNTSGGAISGETASTYLPDETVEGETFYYYEAIGDCGTPVVSETISINVNSLPGAPLLNSNYVICNDPLPDYVDLEYNESLNWYSDMAKTTSLGVDSIPTNSATTIYYISQTINGCEGDVTSVEVEISDCLLDVPTAFTPDGDNVNDTWQLVDLDNYFPKNIVTVYSRWGELLYTSPEGDYESFPWDGKLNDEILPVGSYYYFIDYNDGSGGKVNGVVTVILNK